MRDIKFRMLNGTLSIMYDKKTFSIKKEDKRYERVVDAIRSDNLQIIPGIIDLDEIFKDSGFVYNSANRTIKVDGGELPDVIEKKLLGLMDEGAPLSYLVKFWRKLNQNPSFNSRTMLYKFLDTNGIPVTNNGSFIAYRVCNRDFKDKHTNTFDNSVGKIVEMDRREVNDNPAETCSNGLHVCSWSYIGSFKGGDDRLLLVEIQPEDVVAVPNDYNGSKMRVCRFKVLQEYTENQPLDKEYFEIVEPT